MRHVKWLASLGIVGCEPKHATLNLSNHLFRYEWFRWVRHHAKFLKTNSFRGSKECHFRNLNRLISCLFLIKEISNGSLEPPGSRQRCNKQNSNHLEATAASLIFLVNTATLIILLCDVNNHFNYYNIKKYMNILNSIKYPNLLDIWKYF